MPVNKSVAMLLTQKPHLPKFHPFLSSGFEVFKKKPVLLRLVEFSRSGMRNKGHHTNALQYRLFEWAVGLIDLFW